jgi:hypothetical protein
VSFASTNVHGQDRFTHEDCETFVKQIRTSRTIYPVPTGAMICETTDDITKYYRIPKDPTAKQKILGDASRCKVETGDVSYTLVKAEDDLIIRDFTLLREWKLDNPTSAANGLFRITAGMIQVRRVGQQGTGFSISPEWAPYPSKGKSTEMKGEVARLPHDSSERVREAFIRMATPETMLAWLKEAGTYALQREDPDELPPPGLRIDVLVSGATIGVRVTRGDKRAFSNLTWPEIERARLNPVTQLIDDTIAALGAVSPVTSKGQRSA